MIVLNNRRSVIAEGTGPEGPSIPSMLATMEQVAARWQIRAQLRGTD
jgi:hypothetical protein